MPRRRLTRRELLKTGALGAVAAGLVKPAPALAAPAALFEVEVGLGSAAKASAAAWRESEVMRAPRRFDLMGLAWHKGTLQAQVRTRRTDGRWSPWVGLAAAGGHGPDGTKPLRGTDPAFTGPADYFQVRVHGNAEGVRARFVRAQPTARAATRLARRGARSARLRAPGRATQAGVPPQIIFRDEWGAAVVPPRTAPSYGRIDMAFIHHTATSNNYTPEQSAGIVLGIARYHRDSNRWSDIGYNFLVDKYGQIFEGRSGGIDQAVIGAQAQGFNSVSTGISCLGDFTTITQSPAAVDAIARLLAWKLSLHGTPVSGQVTVRSAGGATNRFASGVPVTFERISGHRDGNNTSCPGALLYKQLAAIRDRAARYATPASASALTLTAAAGTLRHPATAELSGALRLADGSSAQGLELAIEFREGATDPWAQIGTALCADDGSWQADVSLPRSGSVRASWTGDFARAAVVSAEARLSVLTRLTMRVGSRLMRAGRSVRVSGECGPVPKPRPRVTLVLERRRGTRWVVVRTRRVAVRDGRYDRQVALPGPGLYRITVSAPGATAHRRVRAVA